MKKIVLSLFVMLAAVLLGTNVLSVKAASTATVTLINGASIRTTEPNGIRFEATVSEPVEGASYGMVFAKGTVSNLTINTPNVVSGEVDEVDENNAFRVSMANFPVYAYTQNISVRAYIKVNDTYTYSDTTVTRNIYEVAKAYQAKQGEATEQLVLDIINSCFEVKFNANGGTYKYASLKEMEADFIKDFNNAANKSLADASNFYSEAGNTVDDLFKNDDMYNKWIWMIELFKDLASGTYGVTSGYHVESVKQYQAFIDRTFDTEWTSGGVTSTYGGYHWGVRQAIQALFTSSVCGNYSKNACPDFSNAEVANLVDAAIGDNERTAIFSTGAELVAPANAYHNGYILEGWYEDKDCTIPVTSASKAETVYAKWNLVDNVKVSSVTPDIVVIPGLTEETVTYSFKDSKQDIKLTYYKGTTAFTTLTEAYEAAKVGDKIYLTAGTYSDDLTLTKQVEIYGPNHLVHGTSSLRVEEAILTGTLTVECNLLLSGVSLQENALVNFNDTYLTYNVELAYAYVSSVGVTGATYATSISGKVGSLNVNNSFFEYNTNTAKLNGIGLEQANNITVSNNTFSSIQNSQSAVAIRVNTLGTSAEISNNKITWLTQNFAVILGNTANTATKIDIISNTFAGIGETTKTVTSGICVRKLVSSAVVKVDSNKVNYMAGNIYDFAGSAAGAKVYLTNNVYDDHTEFKLSSYGSATIVSTGNKYWKGVNSSGYQPDDK